VSDKKKYVIIHAHDPNHPGRVLLVEKDRPAWQKGCLNLLGGKVEPGETELETALRELKEESGLPLKTTKDKKHRHEDVKLMGAIATDAAVVYCVSLPVDSTVKLKPRKGETEIAAWYEWDTVKSDKRLIPNLLCIVPLCMAGVTGWFVNGTAVGDGVYDVTVRLLLDHPIPHKPEE
jgi:8-oxo-dGTP diphosphatase